MATKEHLRELAQMARRVSANIVNQDVVDRLNAISRDFDQQADEAGDAEAPGLIAVPRANPPELQASK